MENGKITLEELAKIVKEGVRDYKLFLAHIKDAGLDFFQLFNDVDGYDLWVDIDTGSGTFMGRYMNISCEVRMTNWREISLSDKIDIYDNYDNWIIMDYDVKYDNFDNWVTMDYDVNSGVLL